MKFILTILLFLSLIFNNTNAKEKLTNRDQQISLAIQLAKNLMNDGYNQQALLNFNDFIELYPEADSVKSALWDIVKIYELQQEYQKSINTLEIIYSKFGSSETGLKSLYEKARILEFMGLEQDAINNYNQILNLNPDSTLSQKARLKIKILSVVKLSQKD